MRKGFLTGLLAAASVLAATSGSFATEAVHTYLVSTSAGSYSNVESEIGRVGGFTSQRFSGVNSYAVKMTASDAARLALRPGVTSVEADGIAHIDATQSPTPSWGLDRTDQTNLPLDSAYSYPDTAGLGVRVYIVDTGVQGDNPDFAGRMAPGIDEVTSGGNPAVDCNGHGTHTAGTAAGSVYGIAKFATIVPVRVLDCAGSGSYAGIVAGLNWISANNPVGTPAVVSMSLGGSVSTALNSAIAALSAKNIVSVVAAGNSTADACNSSPSSEPTAITVGASDQNDVIAYFSNYGSCVDMFAPGVSITSDLNKATGGSQVLSGTSMATPHVTGAVAEYLSLNPTATTAQVTAAIIGGATAGKITGANTTFGNYLLNTTFINNAAAPVSAAPNSPTGLTAGTVTGSSIAVSWSGPVNTGGNPATSYFVEFKPTSGSIWTGVSTLSTSYVATGLTGLTSYDFRVSAVNTIGSSAATSTVSATTLGTAPGSPTGLIASPITYNSVTLNWSAPANTGSSAITSYTVEYKRSNVTAYTSVVVNSNSTTITGLTASASYNFRVSATNASGTSAPSAVLTATTTAAPAVPSAPRSLAVATTYGDALSLRWTAPTTVGSGITSYTIQRSIGGVWTDLATVSGTTLTYVSTGLTASTSYQHRVIAINSLGAGPASTALTATTGTGVPAAVSSLRSANLTTTGATLSWAAVAAANYSTPTTYTVKIYTSSNGAVVQTITGLTATSLVATGLTTKTAYQFDVTAVSGAVSGTSATKVSFTTR